MDGKAAVEVEVNHIRDGVITTLVTLFPDALVTGEKIRQGIGDKRFFVKLLSTSQQNMVARRYRRLQSFDIHFFAKTNEEAHAVAETLYDGLRYITANGLTVRGTAMSHEIVDDVLHFMVDYPVHVMEEAATGVTMQTLEQEGTIK
jgi:hypothetical protein